MKSILMLKLGPLILIVNLFFSISVFAQSKYEERTRDIIQGDLRKFIFSKSLKTLPNPMLLDEDESVIEIGFKKNILVINFWATWCAPCKQEMPSLNDLAKNMKKENVRVITVASGRNSKEAINAFFDSNKLVNLNKYRDPRGKMALKYSVTALPTTVVVDHTGREIGRVIGDINWNTAEMRIFLKKLMVMK